jgi:AraC-like DNA-binding protein
MFYFVGIIITFFLSVLLITKKNKSIPDWILAIWLILIGIHLLLYYLFISGRYLEFPYFLGFDRPLPLLHGPMLFLYTAYSTDQVKRFPVLHFMPYLVAHIILFPFLILPQATKVYIYQNAGVGYESVSAALVWVIIVSGIFYVAWSLLLLRRHSKNIEAQFSNTVKINLTWLRYLIFGLGFVWLMVIYGDDLLVFGSVVVYVFFLGFFGIRQVGIFTHHHPAPLSTPVNEAEVTTPPSEIEKPESSEIKKYQKSGLNDEVAIEIHQTLNRTMENEKLFKNPELTLPELSQKLAVNPNTLSQVINTREGKNFYDYINSLRIEDFKKLVLQPESQKYSLLGLATQCGFNSKTSFNRNFKKATGLSPSEFLRQNNIQLG